MTSAPSSPEVILMERCNRCDRMVPEQSIGLHQQTTCSGRARDGVLVDSDASTTRRCRRRQQQQNERQHNDPWACPRCTLWNPIKDVWCNACLSPRAVMVDMTSPVQSAEPTRTSQRNVSEPSSPLSFVSGAAVVGGILGGAGAYLRGRSIGEGMLEGAMTGAVSGAVVHGVLTSSTVSNPPETNDVATMRSAGALGYPAYPSMDHNMSRQLRQQPRASMRVVTTNNVGGTLTSVIRTSNGQTTQITRPGNEDPFLALLMANIMDDVRPQGQDIDRMSYQQLLDAFGDGSENRGADNVAISRLPTKIITSIEEELPPDVRECSICLENFTVGCSRKTLPCWHGFHEECVDKWLQANGSCPICKHDIK